MRTGLTVTFLLLFSFMMYPNMLPKESFAEPGVAAETSISITPSTHASLSLIPGTFNSVTQTITSSTTNYTGYVLTFATEGETTNLVNVSDDTLTFPTITLGSGQTSITSSSFIANTYGYSTNGTDYKPVPSIGDEYTLVSTATANVTSDTSTLTFGALVDTTTLPGDYQRTFTLSATANDVGYLISYIANAEGDDVSGMPSPNPEPEPTSGLVVNISDAEPERDGYRFLGWAETSNASAPDYAPGDELLLDPETANITTLYAVWKKIYTIIYVGNDADGGSMSMVSHVDVVQGDTINLYASNFNRDGYGFLGWSFDQDAAETIGTYNESRIYGPNEEIIAPDYVDNEYSVGSNLIMPLFAIWLESSGTIQDWTGCNSLSTGDVIALTDSRDSETYAIAKLSDDNCWMMENMRLSLENVVIDISNTNHPTEEFATTYSGSAPTSWSNWGTGYWQYKYNTNNINRSLTPSPTNNDDNSSWYSYGVQYSWLTAMAGNKTELSGDLCPSGWRFPTSSEMTSFVAEQLEGTNAEKAKKMLKYPINYILSGGFTFYQVEASWPWDFYIRNRGTSAMYALSDSGGTTEYDDDTFDIGYSAYVGGGYSYKSRVAKCRAKDLVTATITYDANGGAGAPTPTSATPATGHYTFTISSTIPTRSGYTFFGWTDGNGTEVFPNETFITYNPSTTFYAIWTNDYCNPNATTIDTGDSSTDAVCLQDINTTIKSNMTSKETYTLIDARDNKEYTISLLDDSNIWMTKNLELGDSEDKLLSSYDTDLETGTMYLLSGSNYIANNTYGNFYNWLSSTANTKSSTTPITSICPAGWDLPTNSHYSSLNSKAGFGSNNLPSSEPYSFNTGGGFYSGNTVYNEGNSYLWTSVAVSSSAAYGANVIGSSISVTSSTGTSASYGANRTYKRNLRCIANNGNITITYHGNGSEEYPVTAPSTIERIVPYNEGKIVGNSFVRKHYVFKNWNSNANGSGNTITVGANVSSLNGHYDIYAQWNPRFVVVYHSNDINESTIESDVNMGNSWVARDSYTFTPTTANTKIASWNTEPDGSGTTYNVNKSSTAPSNLSQPEFLNLYAQWAPMYSFVYNGNGADGGSMAIVQQDDVSVGDSAPLIAPNFRKAGYGFVGWSLDQNATANGNSVIYGPNEAVEVTSSMIENYSVNGVVTFYAVWMASNGTFQNFDPDDYANSPNGTIMALRDERDDNVYTIAKLADGKWWMTENLRLRLVAYGETEDNKTIVGAKSITDGTVNELTIFNTNNPKESFLKATNFSEDWKLIGNTGGSSANYSRSEAEQINIGIGNINLENDSDYKDPSTVTWGPHQDKQWYSYGMIYNYFAATAGNGIWSGTALENSEGSICPIGWRLPSAYASDSDVLNLKSLITSFTSYPTNLVKSGSYMTGPTGSSTSINESTYYKASYGRGTNSEYWTSTFGSTTSSERGTSRAYIMSDSMYAQQGSGTTSEHKVYGAAVRCIANERITYTINYHLNGGETGPSAQSFESTTGHLEHISNVTPTRTGYTFVGWMDKDKNIIMPNDYYVTANQTTDFYALWENNFCNPNATTIGTNNVSTDAVCLQDMNQTIKNSMTSKETYTLIDNRDGKEYNVSLLDDGNVWMTGNLAFGDDEVRLITSTDTDLKDGDVLLYPANVETFVTNKYNTIQVYEDSTYGNYYSWAAAIASDISYTDSKSIVTSSICPANWNLPTSSQYVNLKNFAGFTQQSQMITEPYNFVKSGYRGQSSFTNQGDNIYLWTSNVASNNTTYYSIAYYGTNNTISTTTLYKYYGLPIRCLLSNGTITVHYDTNGSTDYPVSGTIYDQIDIELDVAKTLTDSSPTYFIRTGFKFTEWNTKRDGTGIAIPEDTELYKYGFKNGDEITLYAQWIPLYNVIFHSNDANNTTTSAGAYKGGTWTARSSTQFPSIPGDTKIGYWSTEPDGSGTIYYPNTLYPVPSDITEPITIHVYAQWTSLYTVVYDGNGADEGTMANVTHINVGVGDRLALYASNYSKDGYGFAGWSFDSNATVNSNSTIYGPNEKALITTNIVANNINDVITLYAVWVAPSGTMQNFNCSALNDNEVVALTDTRDKDVYTVAKYVDSENNYSSCWMMENLRLDNTYEENGNTVTVTMDTTNTQGFGGAFTALANPEQQYFASSTASNSLYSTSNITGQNTSSRFPRYNNTNTANRDSNPTITDNKLNTTSPTLGGAIYSHGNYYTWPAAIADTSYYKYNTSTDVVGHSICPKGWHLPSGSTNGEIETLVRIRSVDNIANYPLNFLKSGQYSGTSIVNSGTYGYYWSSATYYDSYSNSRTIYITSNQFLTYIHARYYGNSVRCIADAPAPEQNSDSVAPDELDESDESDDSTEESTPESSTDDTIESDSEEKVEESENQANEEESETNEDTQKEESSNEQEDDISD